MAAPAYHVVHSFLAGKKDSAGAFRTDGKAVYSYNMQLAHKDADGNVVYDYKPRSWGNAAPSKTTAVHMTALEVVCKPPAKPQKNPKVTHSEHGWTEVKGIRGKRSGSRSVYGTFPGDDTLVTLRTLTPAGRKSQARRSAAAARVYGKRPREFVRNPAAEADEHLAIELKDFIDNDGALYRSQTTAIHKNLQAKVKKGTYDSKKAPVLFGYLVDAGAKKYHKEFGDGGPWHKMFDVPTRKLAAQLLTADFELDYLPRHNPKSKTSRPKISETYWRRTSNGAHNPLFVSAPVDDPTLIEIREDLTSFPEGKPFNLPLSTEEQRQKAANGWQRLHKKGTTLRYLDSERYNDPNYPACEHIQHNYEIVQAVRKNPVVRASAHSEPGTWRYQVFNKQGLCVAWTTTKAEAEAEAARHPGGFFDRYTRPKRKAKVQTPYKGSWAESMRKNPEEDIDLSEHEVKIEPLWWQERGLSYTASGYGKKIPTTKMVHYKGKWRRIYVMIYSNSGSAYIIVDGKRVFCH